MAEQRNYVRTADEKGSINISDEVIAAIVAAAATEVSGVSGLYYSPGRETAGSISRKEISRSVKLVIDGNDVKVDVYILLSKSHAANEVGAEVQKAVITAVEDAAGIVVREVNVHICGVVLKNKSQVKPQNQPPSNK